jgi:flagellar biosynthesis anti-sigma factor FlgM
MKIEGISPVEAQLPVESAAARVVSSGQASTQGAVQDTTSFHSDSNSVQSLTAQALNSPEIRQGKVDALRDSVNSAQYQVNPSKIATAISTSGE